MIKKPFSWNHLVYTLTCAGLFSCATPLTSSSDDLQAPLMQEGRTLLEKEDYAGAWRTFERALEINPYDAEVYFYLASIKIKENQNEQALAFAAKGLRVSGLEDTQRARFHVLRTVALRRLGRDEEAKKAALKTGPYRPNAATNEALGNFKWQ